MKNGESTKIEVVATKREGISKKTGLPYAFLSYTVDLDGVKIDLVPRERIAAQFLQNSVERRYDAK